MLPLNTIEKKMKAVCTDYIKGEETMEFTTDDGYTIKEGIKIYYTGDMANIEGTFTVAKIEPCNFYEFKITLREEGENRRFTLTPTNFDSGVGRRFKPMGLVTEERMKARKRLHDMGCVRRKR